jgi:hypothetical protein
MSIPQAVTVYRLLVEQLDFKEVHHGGCMGADMDFDYITTLLAAERIVHPCDLKQQQGQWNDGAIVLSEKPPLERNDDIIQISNTIIATPKSRKEQIRGSGTWYVIRHTKQRNDKCLIIVWPNGEWDACCY